MLLPRLIDYGEVVMTDDQKIAEYVQDKIFRNGRHLRTSLELALRDARQATNRDPDTGAPKGPPSGSWLGCLCYMALLDHVGGLFVRKDGYAGFAYSKSAGVIRALCHFSTLSEQEANVLYALRCSLAHDFALANIPENANKVELRHRFMVTDVVNINMIEHPTTPWDGQVGPKMAYNDDTLTVVSLPLFGNLVEDVIYAVKQLGENGDLQMALATKRGNQIAGKPLGVDILEGKYTVMVNSKLPARLIAPAP